MSNANRTIWQFPKNVAGKVLGWRSDGKGMENKDWADPASKQDASPNLTTLAGITPGSAGQALLADATQKDAADYLGVIPNMVTNFAADGGGVNSNNTAFGNANTAGGLHYIPKPATRYEFASTFTTTAAAWLPDPTQSWVALTDSGQFDMHRGHFTGAGNGANIWRFADRVFIGEAASKWAASAAGVPDAGASWFSSNGLTGGPAFLGVSAALLVTTEDNAESGGRYAIVGAAKTSATAGNAIGVSGAVLNTGSSKVGWALYADAARFPGAGYTYGIELAVKDASGVDVIGHAYGVAASSIGIWMAAGGDNAYGPASTNPNSAAIVIGANSQTWNTGIIFRANGVTGTDGTSGSATFGQAICMARNHDVDWYEPTNNTYGAKLRSTVTAQANRVSQVFQNNAINFRGANESPILLLQHTANSVNYVAITNSGATGTDPIIAAAGSDTNIDLRLQGKGTGVLRFGTWTTNADAAVNGYVTIQDDGGTVRKLATIA